MSMSHEQKLNFVLKMTKHALEHVQHFDSGGTVLAQSSGGGAPGLAGFVGNALGTSSGYQGTSGTNTGQLQAAYDGSQRALEQLNNLGNTLSPGVTQGAGAQSGLVNQLQAQALGGGPNPAQAALNQNTGQNIAQQAALAAGTRGAGANAGLIAANNAHLGANIQQNAVGQAATLQAQQQLAAQKQLADVAANQISQGTNAIGMGNQYQQGEQGILQNANAANNTVNADVAKQNQAQSGGILSGIGGALGGIGGAIIGGPAGAALGGKLGDALGSVFHAEGGFVGNVPDHLIHMANIYHPQHLQSKTPAQPVPIVEMKAGGKVSGTPLMNHNSYRNDTVPALLSPGEVVIDLNTLKDKGKIGQMARFVAKNIERKKAGRSLV